MTVSKNGLFASEFSAMTQRDVMREPYGRAEYIGQLRFDALLAGRLVVPDSQLLDGRLFRSRSAQLSCAARLASDPRDRFHFGSRRAEPHFVKRWRSGLSVPDQTR